MLLTVAGWEYKSLLRDIYGETAERTFEDSHGSGEVVNSPRSSKGSSQNPNGWDEIVCESVVEVSLS